MAKIEQQVRSASDAIDRNISTFTDDRGFLSQNELQCLCDIVEAKRTQVTRRYLESARMS